MRLKNYTDTKNLAFRNSFFWGGRNGAL